MKAENSHGSQRIAIILPHIYIKVLSHEGSTYDKLFLVELSNSFLMSFELKLKAPTHFFF
jgi:hypothetical protein